jgi:protoporphyrinogen oxidase
MEHTNLVPPEVYGGRRIVYLSDYVLPEDPKWKMRDAELWSLYLPALARINPRFDSSWILRKLISRGEYAQPIIPANYSRLLPPIKTPVPGLYSACMAQIYPEDRGQNYAVKIGREAAAIIHADRG